MKFFSAIVGFFKSLFGIGGSGDCDDCQEKACQTTDKNKKYVVIVGMEQSKWGSCPGSDKDSNTMLDLIQQYVNSDHIVKLNNGKATVEAVRKALTEQIAKVPEDGLMIFTYSGHGGQNPKGTSKDETDGQDEFLGLYDGKMIDDELWTIFSQCKGRTLFIVDACHSSTMYRLPSEEIDDSLDDAENRLPIDGPFMGRFANVRAAVRLLCISGCGEETVSWGDA